MEEYGARWPEVEILTAQKTRDCGKEKRPIVYHSCGKAVDLTGLNIGYVHNWGTKSKKIACPMCHDLWEIKYF